MKKIFASIGIIVTLLLSACGSDAAPAAGQVETNEKSIAGVYNLVGMTGREVAVSLLQVALIPNASNAELHFNDDGTGVLIFGEDVTGFTYDKDGNMFEEPNTSPEATPEDGKSEDNSTMQYTVIDDYVMLLQLKENGTYEGVLVFKKSAA